MCSFPVYKPILKEIKLQWEEANGTIHVFEEFAHPSNLLDHEQGYANLLNMNTCII